MLQKIWFMMGRFIVQQYLKHILHVNILKEAAIPSGPKIIVANHPSTSDPAFVTTLFNEQTSILILDTLFKVPLFGRSLRMAGHIPVQAGNGKAALKEGERLLKLGRSVIVFPEGAISPKDCGYQKAHTGAARLALCTGIQVVPVGIGIDCKRIRIINTKVDGKSELGTWYLDGPYAMTVGEAVTYSGNVEDYAQVQAVTGDLMQRIAELRSKSDQRLAVQTPRPSITRRAARQANQWYTRSATLRVFQSSLLFMMLFARHF